MYAAEVDSQRLSFQASGSLWQDALVMQDLETKSLWAQVYGRAIDGPKTGKTLRLFPSSTSTFAEFKKRYPNGVVLRKPPKDRRGSPYDSYFADSSKLGIFGRSGNYTRLPGKAQVFGIRLSDRQFSVSLEHLKKHNLVVIDQVQPPIVVLYSGATGTANAYRVTSLSKEQLPMLTYSGETVSLPDSSAVWTAATGRLVTAHSGRYAALEPVPIISAYWFAWAGFFPQTELIK